MNIESLILNGMPKNLNDLEKARYIYLKLAMYLSFNTSYNNTTDFNVATMYTEGSNIDASKFNLNQVICKGWSAIYSKLLNSVGVDNKIISSGHDYVSFNYKGKIWSADATTGSYTDLSRIRYGDRTYNFGISESQNPNKPLSQVVHYPEQEKLLDEIDKKFDFYRERKLQLLLMKEKIKSVNDKEKKLTERLENFFEVVGPLKEGYYESKNFVKDLEYDYFESEMSKIHGVELKRTHDDFSVDIVQCICVKDKDKYSYFLLAPNTVVRRVDEKEIVKLATLGYGIEDDKIPGIIFPKKFKVGVPTTTTFKYKIARKFISGYIKEYDDKQLRPLV